MPGSEPAIVFHVPGPVIPKGRPRTVTRDGKSHTYTPKRTKDYEGVVKLYALQARGRRKPFSGNVSLDIEIRGKGRGDLDNQVKSLLDALNGVLYNDDKQVVELHVIRQNGAAGVTVRVIGV